MNNTLAQRILEELAKLDQETYTKQEVEAILESVILKPKQTVPPKEQSVKENLKSLLRGALSEE